MLMGGTAPATSAGGPEGREAPRTALLGPDEGPFVATADDLQKWALLAKAGEACVYARAERLPRGSATAERANALASTGMVQINHVRHAPGSPLFDYRARRTAQPLCCDEWRDTVRPASRAAVEATASDEAVEAIYAILRRDAAGRRRCRTNAVLAQMAGLDTPAQAAWCMAKLRESGRIRSEVELTGPYARWRTVTIAATGKSTLPPPRPRRAP